MSRAFAAAVLLLAAAAAAVARPADPPAAPLEPAPPDSLGPALKRAKLRAAALDRLAGPHEPFDLSYLPRPMSEAQTVLAVRPNLIFGHPDLEKTANTLEAFAGVFLTAAGGRAVGPGVTGVDQLVLCGRFDFTPGTPSEGKTVALNFAMRHIGGTVRAARPYDWDAAVKAWFPKGEARTHRGYAYRLTPTDSTADPAKLAGGGARMAYFVAPDGRTLVLEDEPAVVALIDRIRDGAPAATPLGWDRVAGCVAAAAFDNRDKPWVWAMASPGPAVPRGYGKLLLAVDHFAVGLDIGRVTRVRLAALARDPLRARHARSAAAEYAARLRSDEDELPADAKAGGWGEVTDALVKAGTLTPTPLGFEVAAEAPVDVFAKLAELAAKTPPAAPPRPADAPPSAILPPGLPDIPRTRSPIPGDAGVPGYVQPAAGTQPPAAPKAP